MLDYPGPDADSIRGQWAALEAMKASKLVGSLAVSNFSPAQLDVLLADKVCRAVATTACGARATSSRDGGVSHPDMIASLTNDEPRPRSLARRTRPLPPSPRLPSRRRRAPR